MKIIPDSTNNKRRLKIDNQDAGISVNGGHGFVGR